MADEKITMGIGSEEVTYIIPPHPDAHIVEDEKTINPEQPITAEVSLPVLIQQAVDGLRTEMKSELELQAQSIQFDLQTELKKELQKERKEGLK